MKANGMIYHNGYYRLSRLFSWLKYGILAVILLGALFLFVAFRQDMTLNHFRYLLNNFDFSPNAGDTSGDTIYYDGDSKASFGFVSGGFATLTDSRIFVTDRSSTTTFSDYHGFKDPKGVFSKTYMLIYDRSGASVKIYNAFSHLKTLTFSGTVIAAALDDDGNFAVAVSEEAGYYTKVYVYNDDFKKIREISKYKYLTHLSMKDGEVTLGSRYLENGRIFYEIMLLDIDSTAPHLTVTVKEPVYLIKRRDAALAVVTKTAYTVYRTDGTPLDTVPISLAEKSFLFDEAFAFLSYAADTREKTLTLIDKNEKHTLVLSSELTAAAEDQTHIYFLCEQAFWLYDKSTERFFDLTEIVSPSEALALTSDGKYVYLATPSRADRLYGETLIEALTTLQTTEDP